MDEPTTLDFLFSKITDVHWGGGPWLGFFGTIGGGQEVSQPSGVISFTTPFGPGFTVISGSSPLAPVDAPHAVTKADLAAALSFGGGKGNGFKVGAYNTTGQFSTPQSGVFFLAQFSALPVKAFTITGNMTVNNPQNTSMQCAVYIYKKLAAGAVFGSRVSGGTIIFPTPNPDGSDFSSTITTGSKVTNFVVDPVALTVVAR